MKISIYPIASSLHDAKVIDDETMSLIRDLKKHGDFEISISNLADLYSGDLALILVQSGGSEGIFLNLKKNLRAPYYLLTYGTNNSLAASMEILSYLRDQNEPAEILHGSSSYIANKILELGGKKKEEPINLGVIGKPSDWLIASHVDRQKCLEKLNINLMDIDIKELTDLFKEAATREFKHQEPLSFDTKELDQAKRVSVSLDKLVNKYHLKGLTIRCFDLLGSIHTTGCLGLSMLNKDKIIGACEGDVPAMLSMVLLNRITGQPGFQANPSRIDTDKNQIILAHCTLPLDMAYDYRVMTHFESGIGVALRGKMRETDITIFKLSRSLRNFYCEEGKILTNLEDPNLCRTQILVQLEDVRYFLTAPYGNHHLVVYGKHKQRLSEYCHNNL